MDKVYLNGEARGANVTDVHVEENVYSLQVTPVASRPGEV